MQLDLNGHSAYAYTGGKAFDAALPTVVFIHGAQNDHSVWGLQSRWFAHHGYGVLAVDLPGHGRSGGPALASVEAMADWLLALLDAAGVRRALLAGHSMGSLVALEAASRAPGRVRGLAMLGTTWPMKVSDSLLATSRDDEDAAIDMVNIWSHSGIAQKPSSPGPGFSVMGGARRLMQRMSAINPDALFHTDFAVCNAYANGEAAAGAVFRPDVYRRALGGSGEPMPGASMKLEGAVGVSTGVGAHRGALMLGPDRFFDGRVFDPERLDEYLAGFGGARG